MKKFGLLLEIVTNEQQVSLYHIITALQHCLQHWIPPPTALLALAHHHQDLAAELSWFSHSAMTNLSCKGEHPIALFTALVTFVYTSLLLLESSNKTPLQHTSAVWVIVRVTPLYLFTLCLPVRPPAYLAAINSTSMGGPKRWTQNVTQSLKDRGLVDWHVHG